MTEPRQTLAVVLALALVACGGDRPLAPLALPEVDTHALDDAPLETGEGPGGLRLVRLPARGERFSAALLFAAGPVDDPVGQPGLTGLLPQLGLLGTEGDPNRDAPPLVRAMAAGAWLLPVYTGALVGWTVEGPAASADRLLALLADLATRPELPATRLLPDLERRRERIEAEGRLVVQRAFALAYGNALGLGRALLPWPDPRTLTNLQRESILRHWREVVRADRGVFVMSAPAGRRHSLPPDLASWTDPPRTAAPPAPCPASRTTGHVLVTEMPADRVMTLVGVRAPGPGSPDRPALEAALAWANGEPGGPIEQRVGSAAARLGRLRLQDLGPGPGGGTSVVTFGASGEVRPALTHLWELATWVREVRSADAGEAGLDEGRRAWWGAALADRDEAHGRLQKAALRALYGAPGDRAPTREEVARILDDEGWRRGLAIIGVGPPELGNVLGALGPVTLWSDDGAVTGGATPPGCPRGGRGGAGGGAQGPVPVPEAAGPGARRVDAPRQSP